MLYLHMQELISVIIPVYNTECYLGACLDSVLNQSYQNLEIIVINDGSTDYSQQIATKYAEQDDRIKIYSHENTGPAEVRNFGLSVATGDYIAFVDSDDLLYPDALEILLGVLAREQADMVEGAFVRGTIFDKPKKLSKINIEVFSADEAISNVLYQHKILPSMCGKLIKKNVFEGFEFTKGRLYEDLDIICRLIHNCNKLVYINYPVYFYRQNEKSITHCWNINRLDVLKVTEEIELYIQENYPSLLPAAKDRRLSANFNMYALCNIHGDHENATKCWQHIKKNRIQSLLNPKVRRKNKAGILLSFLGRNVFNVAARRIYK